VEQPAERTGKRTGNAAEAGKLTYPGLLGVEATRATIDRLRRVASEAASEIGTDASTLIAITDYLARRDR
ncbi:MAG: polyprenyl synthetase family protein, partial [Planctomycetota bacterium]